MSKVTRGFVAMVVVFFSTTLAWDGHAAQKTPAEMIGEQAGKTIAGAVEKSLPGAMQQIIESESQKAAGRRVNKVRRQVLVRTAARGVARRVRWKKTESTEEVSAQGNTFSFTHDGLKRTYHLHVPSSYDKTKPMPLLIALHGSKGDGKSMVGLTKGGFNTISDRERVIVVYPNGIKERWNDGRVAHRDRGGVIDDVGFISDLIDYLAQELNLDRRRVYATGMSSGAILSHRLACDLSEKIAAIAPVAGGIAESVVSACSPPRPVAVLAMNGTEDPTWKGGRVGLPGQKRQLLSATATVQFWAKKNGCQSVPEVAWEPDRDLEDGTRVKVETYPCRDGAEVVLYAVEGGGHTWPGGKPYLPRIVGRTSRDIDANEVIWDFFKRHALK